MRETPESLTYGSYLPSVYRFAFLMTGSVPSAAEVLRLTVEQAERGDLSDVRDPRRVKRWLFARARSLCARPLAMPEALVGFPTPSPDDETSPPDFAEDPARHLVSGFASLPEPERSALILFYLYLFDSSDLAETLGIKPAELAPLLQRGRTLLQREDARTQKAAVERPV